MSQGSSGNQTITQQNIPDWAIGYGQDTMDMAKYYTNNQNYRPSTLDRNYSNIRGYNAQGQPNSQVGQFGLNPTPQTPQVTSFSTPITSGMTVQEQRATMNPEGSMMIGPNMAIPVSQLSEYDRLVKEYATQNLGNQTPDANRDYAYQQIMGSQPKRLSAPDNTSGRGPGRSVAQPMPAQRPLQSPLNRDQPTGRGMGRVDTTNSAGTEGATDYESEGGYTGPGWDLDGDGKGYYYDGDGANNSSNSNSSSSSSSSGNTNNQPPPGMSQEEVQALIDQQLQQFDENTITPDEMPTPFQAFDRQRFAAPGQNTLRGEGILAGRYDQRFGEGGTDPFAAATTAAGRAANYESRFSPAALNLTGPTANFYSNVNQGLLADQYGNANQGLTPAQDYSRDFQQNLAQFQDPYTSQVVDQTIQDLDRARRITNNDISGSAAKSGAFGGSREILMRAENNRNFADRTAAAVGQLRSQGFQQAADRAQQEQLQRLGLTASDIQNLRGYQSAGNLQGQNISAQDVRDVRALQSQGALTAQGLRAQSDRDAMNFANQLQMQGNQLGVEQARLAEQFRQGAGALNLQGAGALGDLAQAGIADERQRIADLLASGQAGDARNQQDLDFIFNEFNRELAYPGQQIDLRNAAISPATGSVVTTTQPRYEQNPLLAGLGAGVSTYALAGNPYLAGAAGLLSYMNS